jgi:hypothetical protein
MFRPGEVIIRPALGHSEKENRNCICWKMRSYFLHNIVTISAVLFDTFSTFFKWMKRYKDKMHKTVKIRCSRCQRGDGVVTLYGVFGTVWCSDTVCGGDRVVF